MPEISIVRKMHLQMKVKKRIEANRIIGVMGFRNHFSSHPGRHSWDLCGHPVYWWVLKLAAETKYIEKILLWTEVEQAWKDAEEMSDKFVIWKRSIEECREPQWEFLDDLKTSTSRRNLQESWLLRKDKVEKLLGFRPTKVVDFAANEPLIRVEGVNRMIERYFEDDIAEESMMMVRKECPWFYTRNPKYPEYLMHVYHCSWFETRQEYPDCFSSCGSTLLPFPADKVSSSNRVVFVEVGQDQICDIHNEEDLELARLRMQRRLEIEKKEE